MSTAQLRSTRKFVVAPALGVMLGVTSFLVNHYRLIDVSFLNNLSSEWALLSIICASCAFIETLAIVSFYLPGLAIGVIYLSSFDFTFANSITVIVSAMGGAALGYGCDIILAKLFLGKISLFLRPSVLYRLNSFHVRFGFIAEIIISMHPNQMALLIMLSASQQRSARAYVIGLGTFFFLLGALVISLKKLGLAAQNSASYIPLVVATLSFFWLVYELKARDLIEVEEDFSMNQPTPKSQAAVEQNFVDALERLLRASAGYDEGRISEAPNIAKEVFSFIDPTRGRGLLSNLSLGSTDLISTAEPQHPGNLAPEYRLIHATVGFDGMDYRAFLDRARFRKDLKLGPWSDEVVLAKVGLESIRRGELVKFIRDVEGGGHIGIRYERSQAKFAGLMTGDYIDGYMHLDGGPPVGPELPYMPAFATVRQIGWELEQSLRRMRPDLVSRIDQDPRPGPRMVPIQPI